MRLQNQDIWLGYPKLIELSKAPFPVEVSLGLAKLTKSLQMPYVEIEGKRKELINRYGEWKNGQITVDYDSPKSADFALEFGELLMGYQEISVEKVTLPDKIESTCQDCGHKTETIFLVDPQILMPLREMVSSPSGG